MGVPKSNKKRPSTLWEMQSTERTSRVIVLIISTSHDIFAKCHLRDDKGAETKVRLDLFVHEGYFARKF